MKTALLKHLILASLLLIASQAALHAQYSIGWYKVAGGGGSSAGGQYTVNGTIGQHDAGGPLTGGNYSITSGYWSGVSVVQQPGAPLLSITQSGNSVIVSWPSPSTGFVLQQNSTLAPANWSASSLTVSDNGTNKSVTISPPAGNLFLRLRQ